MSRGTVERPYSDPLILSQSVFVLSIGNHTLVFGADTRVAGTKVLFGI